MLDFVADSESVAHISQICVSVFLASKTRIGLRELYELNNLFLRVGSYKANAIDAKNIQKSQINLANCREYLPCIICNIILQDANIFCRRSVAHISQGLL
jgi:hypothetical protein